MARTSGQGSKLARAIVMRLIFGVVSLLFISLVTFLADEIAPGDLATVRAGEKATLAQVERLREELGLNRPWPVRYVEYITKAVKLDFGTSAIGTQKPIKETLSKAIPMTAKIAFLSVLIAAFFGILLGTTAAVYENRFADRAVLSLSTLGVTIPNYVLLPIMVWIFALNLNYLPTSWAPDGQRVASDIFYLILPVIALSLRPMATLTRLTRASMVDTLRQEYVSLAVAKGVPPFRLLTKHAFRNAILPVLTVIGTSFGYLLTGSFVIERAYQIPGVGFEAIFAITQGDTPMILASTLVTGAMFILVNLLVDLVLPIIDPRIRESQV